MTPRKKTKKTKASTVKNSIPSTGLPGVSNFDGANYSRFRTFLFGLQTNQKGGEVTSWARTELNRRAKRIYNDCPAIRFLSSFLQRHVVGIGLFPIAQTNDEEWNAEMERIFDNWASNKYYCDSKGQKTFWQRQRQCIPDWFRSGESFVAKVFSKNGFPQFQSFASTEIGNNGQEKPEDNIVDGIRLDSAGRVIGYRILKGDGKFEDVPAESMCHVADLERDDGQLRSPTALYSGINPAQDLMEAGAAEKVRHKLQSMITMAVKRESKGAAAKKSLSGVVTKKQGNIPTNIDASGNITQTETQIEKLMETMGGFGALAYLGAGEELQFLQVQGNEAFQTLQQFLIYEIAWSIGINPETAFYLSKLGGTANRAGLEDFAAQVGVIQDRMNEQLNTPMWVWRAAVAMSRGEIRKCKDPEWWKVAWQGPPKMSVDLGRMGTLLINLRNAGMITLNQYWGGQGMGWRESIMQVAKEIRAEKLACWQASDHEEGEEPNITVDYYKDYRVISGRTDTVPSDMPEEKEEEMEEDDTEEEEYRPGEGNGRS
jgi:capsid protein